MQQHRHVPLVGGRDTHRFLSPTVPHAAYRGELLAVEPAQATAAGVLRPLEGLQRAELTTCQANDFYIAQHCLEAFVTERIAQQKSEPVEERREDTQGRASEKTIDERHRGANYLAVERQEEDPSLAAGYRLAKAKQS